MNNATFIDRSDGLFLCLKNRSVHRKYLIKKVTAAASSAGRAKSNEKNTLFVFNS